MRDFIAIDIGNSNTVIGVFRGDELIAHWRIQTNSRRTGDEYSLLFRQLFELKDVDIAAVEIKCDGFVKPLL